jgi:hypothetical protein
MERSELRRMVELTDLSPTVRGQIASDCGEETLFALVAFRVAMAAGNPSLATEIRRAYQLIDPG